MSARDETSHHDGRRVLASVHPQNSPQGTFEQNLVVLVVMLLLDCEKFLVFQEDIFVPVPVVPLEETFCYCLSDLLQSRSNEVSL